MSIDASAAYESRGLRLRLVFLFSRTHTPDFDKHVAEYQRAEAQTLKQERLAREEELRKASLLVFANKQDLEMALEAPEVMSSLDLENISDRTWNIQACSAVSQQGLNEGMEWLIQTINAKANAGQ